MHRTSRASAGIPRPSLRVCLLHSKSEARVGHGRLMHPEKVAVVIFVVILTTEFNVESNPLIRLPKKYSHCSVIIECTPDNATAVHMSMGIRMMLDVNETDSSTDTNVVLHVPHVAREKERKKNVGSAVYYSSIFHRLCSGLPSRWLCVASRCHVKPSAEDIPTTFRGYIKRQKSSVASRPPQPEDYRG